MDILFSMDLHNQCLLYGPSHTMSLPFFVDNLFSIDLHISSASCTDTDSQSHSLLRISSQALHTFNAQVYSSIQDDLDSHLQSVNVASNKKSADDDAELARVMPSVPMPSAPKSAVKPAMTDEERELAELEASMAM